MFSTKKIAAISGLVGGLVVASTGLAHAYAAANPGTCTRDLLGSVTCTQRITGEIPENGVIPHQENCMPVQPLTLPAALGNGTTRIGPKVSCTSTATGVPAGADGRQESPNLF
ncbi:MULTISPECIES: hypothetical protein [Streptomyces]|uniref:hypothetical protein n=1 Tax=Streptomyces TaxID=1883 RepID=UPI0029AFE133|nr:hypothetical protein [Streptomyces sp. WI03-4A]MDX2592859.1 hypothetical protein [Streptomyces sp. WI03-4A]